MLNPWVRHRTNERTRKEEKNFETSAAPIQSNRGRTDCDGLAAISVTFFETIGTNFGKLLVNDAVIHVP